MRIFNLALYLVAFSPIFLLSTLSIASFQTSKNHFVMWGCLSLLLIYFSDRIKWYAVLLIYLPAAYSVYLLVFSLNVLPIIGLASGYILALPLMITISQLFATTPSSIILGYLSGYISAAAIYSAISSGYADPLTFLVYFLRVMIPSVVRGSNSLQYAPELDLVLKPLTAISIVALLLLTLSIDDKRMLEKEIKLQRQPLRTVFLTLLTSLTITYVTSYFFNSSSYAMLTMVAAMMVLIAITSRVVR